MTAIDQRPPVASSAADPNADLGFGSVVARESRKRLLNRDGTFNVRREGLRFWESISAYHYFLTISWSKFLGFVIGVYLALNALFATAYVLCGEDALTGFTGLTVGQRFTQAFFFSVQTLGTIGYGATTPQNLAANFVVTAEALVGLLGFAVAAGIVFARFSRPMAQILFSQSAIIAPYRDINAFMFRVVNQRRSQLVELQAKVLLARRKTDGNAGDREFLTLKLERDRVTFFPLTWTVVHPIDETSPLFGMTEEDLGECDSEFLVLLNGFDETFSQTVHTRTSYQPDEVVWGARFRSIFNPVDPDGTITVDIRKLHELDRVPLNAGSRAAS
jgi:inward rectifier potassium channel